MHNKGGIRMEVEATDSNFEDEVLKSDLPVLVDFWAPWCGPCMMIVPIIKELAKEYEATLKIVRVNVDDAPATAATYGITSIPTLNFFKDGKVVDTLVGARPKEAIKQQIEKIIS